MKSNARLLRPQDLTGPRSFFTDLDPSDPDYRAEEVVRKLKLQLLTKHRVVIAASSLFHKVGYAFCHEATGLGTFLEDGTILPAIRDEFQSPDAFFKGKPDYGTDAAAYFCSYTGAFLSWPLTDNSRWFTRKILEGVGERRSLLRLRMSIPEEEAEQFVYELEAEIDQQPDKGFLTRRKVMKVAERFSPEQRALIGSYTDLIYRISGTRVVNCEGHFPQSNLTRLNVAGNEQAISEETIFWDIFVEAVVSYLTSAIRITPERLDRLTFTDIRKIRASLSLHDFSEVYDNLLAQAKRTVSIDDPDRLILKREEIIAAAQQLRREFAQRIGAEVKEADSSQRAGAMWEVVNVLAMVCNPVMGFIVGCLSALGALPEITTVASKEMSDALAQRKLWLERFINKRLGWSQAHQRAMVDSYRELVQYGLDV